MVDTTSSAVTPGVVAMSARENKALHDRIAELETALRWSLNHLYNANPYYGGVETDEIGQRWELLDRK